MVPIVFAGPSIFGLGKSELAGLDVRPPAACGDILRAVYEGVRVIGLIDGIFESAPSIWHKEILAALYEGIAVFGSASMGALRAAECATFGMIGIGSIFHEYHSGARTADSDVAVAHAPAELNYQPLTEALVDVEATVAIFHDRRLIGRDCATKLIRAARAIHFKERTWPVMAKVSGSSPQDTKILLTNLATIRTSRKTEDARMLLSTLRSATANCARSPASMPGNFNQTQFYIKLLSHVLKRHSK